MRTDRGHWGGQGGQRLIALALIDRQICWVLVDLSYGGRCIKGGDGAVSLPLSVSPYTQFFGCVLPLAMFIWFFLHCVFCRCLFYILYFAGAWAMALAGQLELGSCKFSAGGIFQCRQKKCSTEKNMLYFSVITWIVCRYFGLEKCNFCFWKWKRPQVFPGVNYEIVSHVSQAAPVLLVADALLTLLTVQVASIEVSKFLHEVPFFAAIVFLCRRSHTSILTSSLTCSRWTSQSLPNAI